MVLKAGLAEYTVPVAPLPSRDRSSAGVGGGAFRPVSSCDADTFEMLRCREPKGGPKASSREALQTFHQQDRDGMQRLFGLSNVPAEKRYAIVLADPPEGAHLATYLDIPRRNVLYIKTTSNIRTASEGQTFLCGSELTKALRDVSWFKHRRVDKEAGFSDSAVVIYGHHKRYHPLPGATQYTIGHVPAADLLRILGDESFSPMHLAFFTCSGRKFAAEFVAHMSDTPRTVVSTHDDEYLNLSVSGKPHRQKLEFYYKGPTPRVPDAFTYANGAAIEAFRAV